MSHTVISLRPYAPRPRPADRIRAVWQSFLAWNRDAATRRSLAALDDRALSDIGISRAQAQFIAETPIWDHHR